MKNIAPFLLLAVLLTGCQTNTFTRKHFPERVARIHTVALLPQVHTAMLDTYFGKDPSPAPLPEEQKIRSELIGSTTDQLQQRGFVVKEGPLPGGTNQVWNGLKIQRAFSTLPSKAGRPGAKAAATNLNVDGLIFLDATAYKSTPHRRKITTAENTLSVLLFLASIAALHPANVPGESWQDAEVHIALVDGKTGDVLWTTVEYSGDFETNKPAKAVQNLFDRYPKQKPSKRNVL
jgi:hypothetical protein